MSQVTEQSVRFQTALASIKLIQASAVLDLTEDDFDFLTSNKVWIATDRSRSEERRVGKECRFGGMRDVCEKNDASMKDSVADQGCTMLCHSAVGVANLSY